MKSVLENFVSGFEDIESCLLACVATEKSVLLLGTHGGAKTTIAKILAEGMSTDEEKCKVIVYNCDKENLLSCVGFPDIEALKKGRVEYVKHEKSIFNADMVVLDEISRASKDTQNIFLEILQEKSVFGKPLKYKTAIATANNESYKATYQLDAALIDRFYCVLPIPSANSKKMLSAEEIGRIVSLNNGERQDNLEEANRDLRETLVNIRKNYEELKKDKRIYKNVQDFTSKFFSILLNQLKSSDKNKQNKSSHKITISFRQIGYHTPRLILAIAAYHKTIGNRDFLKMGAYDALKYSLVTKLGFDYKMIKKMYEQIRDMLTDTAGLVEKLKVELTTGTFDSRIDLIEKHADFIRDNFGVDEILHVTGLIVNETDLSKEEDLKSIVRLHEVLEKTKISQESLIQSKTKLFNHNIADEKKKQLVSW